MKEYGDAAHVDSESEASPPGLPRSGGWARDAFKQFQCGRCKRDWRLNKLLQSLDCSATASPEHFLLYKLRVRGRGCREIGDSQRGVHATILARSGLCDVPFLA